MKRRMSAALMILAMATAPACGEPDQPDGPTRVEDDNAAARAQLAAARARIDVVFYEADVFGCLCDESADGVQPAAECSDVDAEPAPDLQLDTACVSDLIDGDPPPEGDFQAYASCVSDSVSAIEACLDDPEYQFCSEEVATERAACFDAAQEQGRACDDEHPVLSEWFDALEASFVSECGLEE